jgi:Spy/CpxP family protein refolding chaperone
VKTILLTFTALLLSLSAPAANNESAQTNSPLEQIGANHSNAIEDRTKYVLNGLALADANNAARVHDIVYAQCESLRAWHDQNDPKIKAARSDTNAVVQIQASLKQLHNEFIAKLSENLTPSQVEMIKDGMTHGVVQVTYNAYLEIVPDLTDADKAKILELLKDGREEAMDAGTSKERAAIIKKYKGKINNYLNAHGHNVAKAYKDWGTKQKAKAVTDSSSQQ